MLGYRSQDGDPEGATLADVRSGKVPFALISARVFDDLGVDAFAPLLAPLAIDSLTTAAARARRRHRRPRASRRSASSAWSALRCCPATLRHPLGLTRPLAAAGRLPRRAYIGVRRSALAKRAFESLGATVGWELGDRPLSFDGIETDLGGIESARLDVGAASLTADVTLWPRLGVVVANPEAWKGLSERRRKAMREAGHASLSAAIAALRHEEEESYGVLCRRGATSFTRTRAADVERLRAALAPVTARLDPAVTKQIAALRAEAGARARPPAVPPDRARAAGQGDADRRRLGVREQRG